MIFCKELNKSFETKEEMFVELKQNIPELMRLKKMSVHESRNKSATITCKSLNALKSTEADKALSFEVDNDYWYIAVNSCWVLDSHDDLHIKGIWDESTVDDQGQNYLLADHNMSIDSTIVKKEYIEIFVATVPFSSIGKSYPGSTQILVYKFRKDKVIHEKAKAWLESGDEIQASVRMRYDDIEFALDSNHPNDKEEKARYDMYYPKIANKDEIEYIYYFFVIKKAHNVMESSLVIFGSNPVTGPISIEQKEIKDIDPHQSSQKQKSNFYTLIH